MTDILDSDGPGYDPDAYLELIDNERKRRREHGLRVGPTFEVADDDVRCPSRNEFGVWRYRCIRRRDHAGGHHYQLEATMNRIEATSTVDETTVWVDGVELDPGPSQALFNHSPDGFAWGYNGSGPAQLALGILFAVTGDAKLSVRLHQEFKRDFVAGWPISDDVEETIDVIGWVRSHPLAEVPDVA